MSDHTEASTYEGTGGCYTCGKPYGTWPDLLVPDAVWAIINPTKPLRDGGGLLCPSCIIEACSAAGLDGVPAAFASGPLRSVEYIAGSRMAFLNDRWPATPPPLVNDPHQEAP